MALPPSALRLGRAQLSFPAVPDGTGGARSWSGALHVPLERQALGARRKPVDVTEEAPRSMPPGVARAPAPQRTVVLPQASGETVGGSDVRTGPLVSVIQSAVGGPG
jgi:hypothetical protein